LAIGAFLGPQLEQGLMQAMVICEGSVWNMLTRPLAGTMLWLALLMIVVVVVKRAIIFMRKIQGGH
jgi:putative tricarboxylic transport membrane protein